MLDYFYRKLDLDEDVSIEYKATKKYFYKKIYHGEKSGKWKRIGEEEFISEYEVYMDEQSYSDVCIATYQIKPKLYGRVHLNDNKLKLELL